MKILVVSDTHGRDERLEIVVEQEQPFDYLIHCGDVKDGSSLLKLLQNVPAPLWLETMISSVICQEKRKLCWKGIRSW